MVLISSKLMHTCFSSPTCPSGYPEQAIPIYKEDIDMMQFAENLEHLEADFFLWSALGYGLDQVAPSSAMGGPPPIGAQKANLDALTQHIIEEFGYQEVGHLRALKITVGGFSRPLLDLSAHNFAKLFDQAFGSPLIPPFDPNRDSLSYMLASYVIPYVGLVGYVGTNPNINATSQRGRPRCRYPSYLYERAEEVVHPYNHTVAEFTIRISELRNQLAMCGIKDEGIIVPLELGAENGFPLPILTPQEVLRIVYGTGDEHVPGGFYPDGGNGRIAREFLEKP
ncbi:hypothetical protein RJ639_044841 [Escallonia herrerae]|uniref:Desiccation-related protein PCC13-62 n=1 Tax=Escallonia herrerae TaxID=1293975 RepID=A0AA89B786_9ASTE|nr:hypothetical protein RJ639_044841 [Escallonia herrerae]